MTKRWRVLVTARVADEIVQRDLGHWEVSMPRGAAEEYLPYSEDRLDELLRGCQAWVTEIDQASAQLLERQTSLKLIVSCRGEPANVDLEAAWRAAMSVCNVPGRNADATADLAVGLLLSAVRRIVEAHNWIGRGMWSGIANLEPYTRFTGFDLNDKILAVVGYGAVGAGVARRCHGFGMRIRYYDPGDVAGDPWASRCASLEEALDGADVVTLHVPATKATEGMIGRKQFEVMKPGVIMINAARAKLVDREALLDALRSGRVGRAGLDVFWEEPIALDDPLLAFTDRLVLTPHIGGATRDVVSNHTRTAVACLLAFEAGERPPTLIEPRPTRKE